MDRTVEQHLEAVLSLMQPRSAVRRPLIDCLGLTLASDIAAPLALPPFDNSAMDGYAVRAVDVSAAPVKLPVTADIAAGHAAIVPLAPGTAQRIMTGAPLPLGADAVVRFEWTDRGTQVVRVDRAVQPGDCVRYHGEDLQPGDIVLRRGDKITAARLGIAAAMGLGELAVHLAPRVAVFATGDELTAPGTDLQPGGIYDSNSFLVSSLVRSVGGDLREVKVLGDDIAAARAELEIASRNSDLIITTGGISAGAYEVVKEALADNPNVDFVTVAMQPGKPQGVGTINGTPLLALPGNPVSAYVSFEVFGRPAMRKLTGRTAVQGVRVNATLSQLVQCKGDRRQYLLGSWHPDRGSVDPAPRSGSHLISMLQAANCLIVIPAGDGTVSAGSAVELMPIGSN